MIDPLTLPAMGTDVGVSGKVEVLNGAEANEVGKTVAAVGTETVGSCACDPAVG